MDRFLFRALASHFRDLFLAPYHGLASAGWGRQATRSISCNGVRIAREEIFRKSIAMSRQQAAAMMQAAYPHLIVQGVQLGRIQGVKVPKLEDIDAALH